MKITPSGTPDLRDLQAVGTPARRDDLADRVGQGGDVVQAAGHLVDPLRVQGQAVDGRRVQAKPRRGRDVAGVGLQDLVGAGRARAERSARRPWPPSAAPAAQPLAWSPRRDRPSAFGILTQIEVRFAGFRHENRSRDNANCSLGEKPTVRSFVFPDPWSHGEFSFPNLEGGPDLDGIDHRRDVVDADDVRATDGGRQRRDDRGRRRARSTGRPVSVPEEPFREVPITTAHPRVAN